ncbi:hypothetical protein [Mycobacterium kansasii]|uniref:hypothetical protein n=1 Tax=Mycobacterium kansasii TaxID=1768 RepID=UPI0004D84FD1|nr:hypothetical protein [Mycobacterium kansasii]KEP41951.1 hypothetical protein MKSMC1_29490 [Mycobacterium kansasii]
MADLHTTRATAVDAATESNNAPVIPGGHRGQGCSQRRATGDPEHQAAGRLSGASCPLICEYPGYHGRFQMYLWMAARREQIAYAHTLVVARIV